MEPLIVGFTLFAIGVAYGLNCGFPVNPARDLAPRLFTYIAQYGGGVWWTYVKVLYLYCCKVNVSSAKNVMSNSLSFLGLKLNMSLLFPDHPPHYRQSLCFLCQFYM